MKRTRNPHQGHFSPPGKLQVSSTKVRKTSIHWPAQSQSHSRRTSKAPILQSALSGELLGGRGISRFFIFCQINSRIVFLLLGSFSSSLAKRGFPILTLLIVDEAQPKRTYYRIHFYFGLPGGTARPLVPRLTASTGRRGSPLIRVRCSTLSARKAWQPRVRRLRWRLRGREVNRLKIIKARGICHPAVKHPERGSNSLLPRNCRGWIEQSSSIGGAGTNQRTR